MTLLVVIGMISSVLIGITYIAQAAYTDSSFDGSIILGRPNNSSITANITANNQSQVYLAWGENTNEYSQKSSIHEASNLGPAVFEMDGLKTDRNYYYRLFFKDSNDTEFKNTAEYTFRTPRAEGESYTFVVQADSHLLNKADHELYENSMKTMAGYNPDFMFDLGDTFLNDQVDNPQYQDYETIRSTSFQQRSFFDIVTRNAPLFLTIGNHEGEYGYFLDGTDKNLTVMSTIARNTYYPNPVPDEFYSGNAQEEPFVGLPQNYYSFEWGDALYVSIDPYRYSLNEPYNGKDGWQWTLGKMQYDWFRKTLEESHAKYKFVFAHHAIGNMRGGAEVANLYEWGGYDRNGKYLFDEKRPGWGKPIQQIMKDTGVTIFFQGHDHLFARENVDGVIYQTLPKPAERIADKQSNGNSYPDCDTLLNSGFLRVNVTPENVQVDYHRNYYVSTEPQDGNTGIVYSYAVDTEHNVKVLKSTSDDFSTYGGGEDNRKVKKNDNGKEDKKQRNHKGNNIKIEINGRKVKSDVLPFIDANGRTQVPVRLLAEQLGCEVFWEEDGQKDTVSIKKGDVIIRLKIGEKNARVNGKLNQLDTAAFIKESRTFVPVRFVSEVLNAKVDWVSKNNMVKITTDDVIGEKTEEKVVSGSRGGIVLGCPTDTSVTIKAIANGDIDVYFEYGSSVNSMSGKTRTASYKNGIIIETVIGNLNPDTQYYYRMLTRKTGDSEYTAGPMGTFHTQRNTGEDFTFTIQADSHRDENSDIAIYNTTLQNVLKDKPDFHIDLGDTFMGEKLGKTREGTFQRYLEDRSLFTKITDSIPLFLVNGNHEGENGWNMQKSTDNVAIWASNARLLYYLNPQNGGFYTGCTAGNGNYYAYTWGDALFVMLDPFWFSEKKAQGNEDGWNYSLGKTQYDWFKNTLENSSAKYKFVFIHNLVGGYGKDARGGIEASEFFEWGGNNFDGSYGFDHMRSGWGKPIHQLMVDNQVTAVFHGHDHFYAKQERDGIIYQLVPQPSHPGNDVKDAAEYSYKEGKFLPSSGHLRVSVGDEKVKVDYINSSLQDNENGRIVNTYLMN